MSMRLTIDTREADRVLGKLGKAADDGRPVLLRLDRAVRAQMAREWNKAKGGTGGVVRGEQWEPYSEQYKRKGGTVVPAWGGVAKVRLSKKHPNPLVKARTRPSGQPVKQSDVLNKDTGKLAASIVSSPPLIKKVWGSWVLEIGAKMPIYGETILGYDNRNILRWIPEDRVTAQRILNAWAEEQVRKAMGRAT